MTDQQHDRTPRTTYWQIAKGPLIKLILWLLASYAVFSLIMDSAMLIHWYAHEVWFYVGDLNDIARWKVPLDMGLWTFVLYKVVTYDS